MADRSDTEDAQFRILRLLENNPELSQRELAKAVGISNGSVHYLLTALVEKGFLKFSNFSSSRDKRRYAYILTPKGVSEKAALTRNFLRRKMSEYEALRSEIAELKRDLRDQEEAQSGPRARNGRKWGG